ncbi:MAG: DUF2520 domain-containing protein [Bacteroidota bacterium]|nr:DUF2520 domain-containing protein [Bacteroidota bacterium]
MKKIEVCVIGSGNIAVHLIKNIQRISAFALVGVFARKSDSIAYLVTTDLIYNRLEDLPYADLYIIAVSDDAISEVSNALIFSGRFVVHTSGTQSLDILSSNNRRGVLYPLQTFSKSKNINFREVPLFVEVENEQDSLLLTKVAGLLSDNIYPLDSHKRKALHVAAVFSSNFVNYLYGIAHQILDDNQLSFEVLKPLIKEVADKVQELSPEQAQTGPARRGDYQTIASHQQFLEFNTKFAEIYKLLSNSILEKYGKL